MNSNNNHLNFTTKNLVLSGFLIAVVWVCTSINVPFPFAKGGLMHLGNIPLFVIAFILGKKYAALTGAVGMGLFDLFSAWAIWAPFTFVIRLVMGYIAGSIAEKGNGVNIGYNSLACFVSGIWMLIGYYFTEVILYGNWIAPFASIPGDIVQLIVGSIIAIPLAAVLRKPLHHLL